MGICFIYCNAVSWRRQNNKMCEFYGIVVGVSIMNIYPFA
jgi:hypothetical protein